VALEVPLVEAGDVPAEYVAGISHLPEVVRPFSNEAERRLAAGQTGAAVRALSSIVENSPSDPEAARLVSYRLASWNERASAAALFLQVLRRRPYEPPSYRDLALVLREERPALSALLFEVVLAGQWHPRFGLMKDVVRDEYAMLARSVAGEAGLGDLHAFLAGRMQTLELQVPEADLWVTITWNTDNTDIDLWVTDPAGEKCYYANRTTGTGGRLLDDLTRGYGPERFTAEEAVPGEYVVQAHYYGNNGNRLLAETHVRGVVLVHAGRQDEEVRHANVVLRDVNDVETLAEVTFE